MLRTVAAREAVVAEARTWLGTPYHHHGRIKGAGVDCAMLLCEVFEACGLVPRIAPGHYAHDWHLHRSAELFLQRLQAQGAQPVQQPLAGDVALFRCGRCWSHGAIVQGPGLPVVHAYIDLGVIETLPDEAPLSRFPVSYWSLFA